MKPMLAGKVTDVKNIVYPVLCTPKLDGIRALMLNGVLVSRNLKRIPNKRIRELFEKLLPDGVDGELILRNGKLCGALFNETSSAVMMEDGEPDVVYHIFDWVDLGMTYRDRVQVLKRKLEAMEMFTWRVKLVLPIEVRNETELLAFEEKCLGNGFEGVMVRSVDGPYKEGRSTEREGYLLKLKRFEDSEALIIGFEELQSNENDAEKDRLGHTKRSSKKAGMTPADTLGAMIVKDVVTEIEFKVGSGFDGGMRKLIWKNREAYLGKTIKYKCQSCGRLVKPRFPIFLGFRSEADFVLG